jgi:hypothetical protein
MVAVGAALLPDRQAPESVEHGLRALNHPAMLAGAFAGLDAPACDATADATTLERLPESAQLALTPDSRRRSSTRRTAGA